MKRASARRTISERRRRVRRESRFDPCFQFRSQAYGQLTRHVIPSFFPSIPLQCNATAIALHRQIQHDQHLHAFGVEVDSGRKKSRPRKVPRSAIATAWWRRGESNPRPKILYSGPLRAFPVVWVSSPGTPAGKVPFGPSREKARPSAPREEASGYPVRVTSSRLYGHSTVGGRRLKPPELTDSRWRLLVSRFLRGAGPRHATHEHRHPRRNRFAPLLLLL